MSLRILKLFFLAILFPLAGIFSCAGTPIPLIAILLAPQCVDNFNPGQTQQFNACVFIDNVRQPGFENGAVTWSVLGGDVNGTITQDGFYTAPNTNPPPAADVTIIAVSKEDEQKQGQAMVIFAGQGTCDQGNFAPECQ
jgi:hypothetical protein